VSATAILRLLQSRDRLSELFLVGFHMVEKQFIVTRRGNSVQMNFDSCFAKFGAEINDLNTSAALDSYAPRYFDPE